MTREEVNARWRDAASSLVGQVLTDVTPRDRSEWKLWRAGLRGLLEEMLDLLEVLPAEIDPVVGECGVPNLWPDFFESKDG